MTSNGDDTDPPIDVASVFGFIEELRRVDGFRIGPREETAVARLLGELFAHDLIKTLRDLRPHLQPLLARTAEERERFALAFDRRFPPPQSVAKKVPPPDPDVPASPKWRPLAGAAAALLIVGLTVWLLMNPNTPETAESTPTPVADRPETAGNPQDPKPDTDKVSITPATAEAQAADDAVTMVLNAAAYWSYAPTLDELSETLGPMIGWRPEGLSIRLHELTGLPRAQPLALLATPGASSSGESQPPHANALTLVAMTAANLAEPGARLDGVAVGAAARAAIERTRRAGAPVYALVTKLLAGDENRLRFIEKGFPREANALSITDKLIAAKLEPALSASDRYRAISLALQQVRAVAGPSEPPAAMYPRRSGSPESVRWTIPEPGAILAIVRDQKSADGTLPFVVRALVNERELMGDLLSWSSSGEFNANTPIMDVSEANDWSKVRIWVSTMRRWGEQVYETQGFNWVPSLAGTTAVPWQPQPQHAPFSIAPAWTPWAAAFGIIGLTLAWLGASSERRKAYLRRRRPETYFSIHELVADEIKDTASRKLLLNRAAQRLQRWTERESDRLDVERTVTATLLAGKLTTVRARAKSQPDYLVLVESSGPNDLQAARLRALARCLEERMLNVKVFYFSATPAWCHAEAPAGHRAPFSGRPVPIEELVSRFGDHRLIVLATGERFGNRADARWTPSVMQLVQWPTRAMLTPLGLNDWSAREFALARELELPLGRATEEGLLALATLLKLDERETLLYSAKGDGRAPSLPQMFRIDRTEWTLAQAPHDMKWSDLRSALVRYLDPDAYFWLCACAVYPSVRWDLTLFLGLTLEGADGAKLYREDRLSALASLPWFREGRMPDWLRRHLIAEVEKEAPAIREVLRQLVERSRLAGIAASESVMLRIATRNDAGVDQAFDDEIFLDFLAKGDVTDLEVSWLDALRAFLPDRARQWLDPAGVAVLVAGLLAAVAAFVLAPRGASVSLLDSATFDGATLPAGAWAPLLVVVVAALVALACVDTGPLRRLGRVSGTVMTALLASSLLALLLGAADLAAISANVIPTEDILRGPVPLFTLGLAMIALVATREIRQWLRRPVAVPAHVGLAVFDFVAKAAALGALALGSAMLLAPSLAALEAQMPALALSTAAMLLISWCALRVEQMYERT